MEQKNILDIYKYGDDVLKLKAKEIRNINEQITRLKDLMVTTLHNTNSGIGLAAPQIGESLQLSVIDLSMGKDEKGLIVLINPVILEEEGRNIEDEGCLSFPGITAPVNRSTRIFLKNIDMNGNEIKQEIEGYLARVIQHEVDHLNGILIIDRVSSLRRQILKKEIKRLQKNEEW